MFCERASAILNRLIVVLVLLFSLATVCSAQRFNVKVVSISDGDTFTGLNSDNLQIKIRIYGIDAPEKKQAFGNKSKECLSSYIFGKTVTVDVQSQDSWGRYIAYVYTPDGRDVSLLMLQEGMAWHFVKYDNTSRYSSAEIDARRLKKGLWSDKYPVAPWDFRASNKHK